MKKTEKRFPAPSETLHHRFPMRSRLLYFAACFAACSESTVRLAGDTEPRHVDDDAICGTSALSIAPSFGAQIFFSGAPLVEPTGLAFDARGQLTFSNSHSLIAIPPLKGEIMRMTPGGPIVFSSSSLLYGPSIRRAEQTYRTPVRLIPIACSSMTRQAREGRSQSSKTAEKLLALRL